MIFYLIFISFIFSLNNKIGYGLSCLDEKGNETDYFSIKSNVNKPDEWFYTDIKNTDDDKLKNRKGKISSYFEILKKIFDPIYKKSDDYDYIQYNDYPPVDSEFGQLIRNPIREKYTNARGALVLKKETKKGIWFFHGIKGYMPSFDGTYEDPDISQTKLQRQFFKCISVDEETAKTILKHLYFLNVKPYVKKDLQRNFDLKNDDEIIAQINIEVNENLNFNMIDNLKTTSGNEFRIISETVKKQDNKNEGPVLTTETVKKKNKKLSFQTISKILLNLIRTKKPNTLGIEAKLNIESKINIETKIIVKNVLIMDYKYEFNSF